MTDAVTMVDEHVDRTLGDRLLPHPGGWPDAIELALIDAIFSARANYGRPATSDRAATGVHAVLDAWRGHSAAPYDDLAHLRERVEQIGFDTLHAISAQRVPGRQSAPLSKWEAVDATAAQLVSGGIVHAEDVIDRRMDEDATPEMQKRFTRTPGVGKVTFDYYLMLLRVPGIKADTMIRAFVDEALHSGTPIGAGDERNVDAAHAAELLGAVADRRGVNRSDLDHTIWNHQRDVRTAPRRCRRVQPPWVGRPAGCGPRRCLEITRLARPTASGSD